jgi:hypothetical protein
MILQGDDGIGIVISDSFRIGDWTQTMPKALFLKAGPKAAFDCFLLIINSTYLVSSAKTGLCISKKR